MLLLSTIKDALCDFKGGKVAGEPLFAQRKQSDCRRSQIYRHSKI